MSIGDICIRDTVFAERTMPLPDAARLMRAHHVGALVVVDNPSDRRPVGVLTDRDVTVAVVAAGVDPASLEVGDLLLAAPVLAREEEGIWEVILRMRDRGVRRVPVVGPDGNLVGIVTIDDILELLAAEHSALVQVIRREVANEVQLRK